MAAVADRIAQGEQITAPDVGYRSLAEAWRHFLLEIVSDRRVCPGPQVPAMTRYEEVAYRRQRVCCGLARLTAILSGIAALAELCHRPLCQGASLLGCDLSERA
jgi:hypothetical protein